MLQRLERRRSVALRCRGGDYRGRGEQTTNDQVQEAARRRTHQIAQGQVRSRGWSRSAIASLGCHGAPNPCMVPRSQKRTKLCSNNLELPAEVFVGKPPP